MFRIRLSLTDGFFRVRDTGGVFKLSVRDMPCACDVAKALWHGVFSRRWKTSLACLRLVVARQHAHMHTSREDPRLAPQAVVSCTIRARWESVDDRRFLGVHVLHDAC